jgi:hypothetical protein
VSQLKVECAQLATTHFGECVYVVNMSRSHSTTPAVGLTAPPLSGKKRLNVERQFGEIHAHNDPLQLLLTTNPANLDHERTTFKAEDGRIQASILWAFADPENPEAPNNLKRFRSAVRDFSLRLWWFACTRFVQYAKDECVYPHKHNGVSTFIDLEKLYQDAFSLYPKGKAQFDPFARRSAAYPNKEILSGRLPDGKMVHIQTSLAQANFFLWAINNGFMDFVYANQKHIITAKAQDERKTAAAKRASKERGDTKHRRRKRFKKLSNTKVRMFQGKGFQMVLPSPNDFEDVPVRKPVGVE